VKHGKELAGAILLGCGGVLAVAPVAIDASQMRSMESRMRIARADRAFQDTQDAANELVDIASGLEERLRSRGALVSSDHKSLDRLKKLAKKIRTDFGGEGAPELEEVPATMTAVAEAISERAKEIDEQIDKVTRYEVNSKLIVLAGDLMILSDAMRTFGVRR
jgi:hypothetical protein